MNKLPLDLLIESLKADSSNKEECLDSLDEQIETLELCGLYDLASALIDLSIFKEEIDENIIMLPNGGFLLCPSLTNSHFKLYDEVSDDSFYMSYVWADMVEMKK